MSREIEFRGKCHGAWAFGYIHIGWDDLNEKKVPFISSNNKIFYSVDPETIGQCTGLKDINGKKIFEGDIITYNGILRTVVWRGAGYKYMDNRCGYDRFNEFELMNKSGLECYSCMVVADIFEEFEEPTLYDVIKWFCTERGYTQSLECLISEFKKRVEGYHISHSATEVFEKFRDRIEKELLTPNKEKETWKKQ